MCKLCRTARIISDEQHRDRDALQQGQINEVWTQGLWAYERGGDNSKVGKWDRTVFIVAVILNRQ